MKTTPLKMNKFMNKLNKSIYIENTLCSQIGRLNILQMAIISRLIYRFIIICMKIPAGFHAEIDNLTLKLKWKCKRFRIKKAMFKKKNIEGFSLPNIKIYYEVIMISFGYQDSVVLAQGQDSSVKQSSKSRNKALYLWLADSHKHAKSIQ